MSVYIEWRCDGVRDCRGVLTRATGPSGDPPDDDHDRQGWVTLWLERDNRRVDLCKACAEKFMP